MSGTGKEAVQELTNLEQAEAAFENLEPSEAKNEETQTKTKEKVGDKPEVETNIIIRLFFIHKV